MVKTLTYITKQSQPWVTNRLWRTFMIIFSSVMIFLDPYKMNLIQHLYRFLFYIYIKSDIVIKPSISNPFKSRLPIFER